MIMRGCNGRMGRVITDIVKADEEIEIVAGIDISGNIYNDYPVYGSLAEVTEAADVLVDFSAPVGLTELLKDGIEKNMPLVLCSTGYSEEDLAAISEASKKVAVFRSANMSLGINVLEKLVKAAAEILAAEGFDMEIVESHHKMKKDAPSGTAIMLADALNSALPEKYEYVYDRTGRREPRPKNEIGISAVRGGSIVGDHQVIFAGQDEVIEIRHTAYSRSIFGKGAVVAAKFLAGKGAGMYNMHDVIA